MTQKYESLKQKAQERKEFLDSKPRVRIGTALCGLAAGAGAVVEAFRRELEGQGIDATVSEVGCIGLCYAEPLVDIQMTVGPRVFYGEVTPEDVPGLVKSHIVEDAPVMDKALAAHGAALSPSVPALDDLEMMKGQVRIALRNAGHTDPTDLYEYIGAGGYVGLDKALSGMTPQEVQEEVEETPASVHPCCQRVAW